MHRYLILMIIGAALLGWSEDGTSIESVSCKISMTVVANKSNPGDVAGTAIVNVTLIDKAGNPIAGREIAVQGTGGTLLCRMPGDTSGSTIKVEDDRSCYTTGENGKVRLYLVNIPVNTTVRVNATAICGDFEVHAKGSVAITRGYPRKSLLP
jgi:hypothetical protein